MALSDLFTPIASNQYTAAVVSLSLGLACYHYYANVYTYFRRRGLGGPTPYPLVGSLLSILSVDRLKYEREWSKQYGKFYGIFRGTKPAFIVNDAELMQQICIKDFATLPNHGVFFPVLNEYQEQFLIATRDDHWRRLRALHNPLFTSVKIKRMFKLLDKCADDLVMDFREKLDEGGEQLVETLVNLKEIYSMYTLDAITTAAYSIKLARKSNSNNKSTRSDFVSLATPITEFRLLRFITTQIVPKQVLKAINFHMIPLKIFKDLDQRLQPIVDHRRRASRKSDDYLQILVDARADDCFEFDQLDEFENHHAALTSDSLEIQQADMLKEINRQAGESSTTLAKAKLTDHEIISSAIFLLLVGIETTATLLTHCTYALAFHPLVQQRLYELIKSMAQFNRETGEHSFDYDKLTSCEYLDAVISETLRSIPAVIQIDRLVSKDYHVEKYNVTLKKDDMVLLNLYSIMNNPEYWPNPLEFNPERFMGENKKKVVPGSYCPFGLGPRHCLGMRFSLTEAKLALAKVLLKFEFSPAPNTEFPPESGRIFFLNNLKSPVVNLKSRQ